MVQNSRNIILISNSRKCHFWVSWTICYKMVILFFKKVLIILRSTKHANLGLGVQFSLREYSMQKSHSLSFQRCKGDPIDIIFLGTVIMHRPTPFPTQQQSIPWPYICHHKLFSLIPKLTRVIIQFHAASSNVPTDLFKILQRYSVEHYAHIPTSQIIPALLTECQNISCLWNSMSDNVCLSSRSLIAKLCRQFYIVYVWAN